MNMKELEEIESIIKMDIKSIAGNSGYGYLDCYWGEWKDGGDYVHKLANMDKRYLNNCLREVNNASRFINVLFESISEIVDLNEYNLSQDEKLQIIGVTKSYLRELMKEKKEEIENELMNR